MERFPGIEAIAVEIPYDYIDLKELENYDKDPNKYTLGLRMKQLAVPLHNDTVITLAEKVLLKLFKSHSVSPDEVGRLEVATESMTDKSKSIKSCLMKHFGTHTRVEGVDLYHACYAGTSALFSAIEWMMGPWWNGKKAIVICVDIARWDSSLRFMNGAGAVALLISPQGNGVIEPIRCTSCTNEYDFYKPISLSFPVVNGRESMNVYLSKLNECIDQIEDTESIKRCKYWIFHCASVINSLKGTKEICKRLCLSSEIEHLYEEKVKPSTEWISESGSLFTASLFTGLANVLYHNAYSPGDNILMYAFGSGAMASLYIIKLKGHVSIYQPWDTQDRIKLSLDKWSDL